MKRPGLHLTSESDIIPPPLGYFTDKNVAHTIILGLEHPNRSDGDNKSDLFVFGVPSLSTPTISPVDLYVS